MKFATYEDPTCAPPYPHLLCTTPSEPPKFVYPTPTTLPLEVDDAHIFIPASSDHFYPASRLGLVSCGVRKDLRAKDNPIGACQLYTGSLFKAAFQRAVDNCEAVLIMSGAHGLLSPNQPVFWYEYKLESTARVQKAWGDYVFSELSKWVYSANNCVWPADIVIYGGQLYYKPIVAAFKRRAEEEPGTQSVTLHAPYAKLSGMGYIMQWLKNADQEAELEEG